MKLKLNKDLIFLDLETTGLSVTIDKIIEIAMIKISSEDYSQTSFSYKINPQMDIPESVSKLTGIYNDDVKDCPTFSQKSVEILNFLTDCDLAGFNLVRFDLPMLKKEFAQDNIDYIWENKRVVDIQRIFHKKEPRTLEAALKFYCNKKLHNAHSALADTQATLEVFKSQLELYDDLPEDIGQISNFCREDHWYDITGKLHHKNGKIIIGFGKKKGMLLETLIKEERQYIDWILQNNFPSDTKEIIKEEISKLS